MKADVIVDLQFGSTAKGRVASMMAKTGRYDMSMRVQSIQAGHTIFHEGKKYTMRTVPCAWVNPSMKLILGPGCFIEKELLLHEIDMIESNGYKVRDRIFLDYRANYIIPADHEAEQGMSAKMGSTGEGAGSSLIRKMWRISEPTRVLDDLWAEENGLQVVDSTAMMDGPNRVLVEGCQGTLLSIHTTPYYPYCTSRECTASGILSEAGIAPADVGEVLGVMRTYPIRVGGNSGPTGGYELTWEEISARSGDLSLIPEKTTVTKRQRRIFEFSDADFKLAMRLNRPGKIFLNFINYINFDDYGKKSWDELSDKSKRWVEKLEAKHGTQIDWMSTGEPEDNCFWR